MLEVLDLFDRRCPVHVFTKSCPGWRFLLIMNYRDNMFLNRIQHLRSRQSISILVCWGDRFIFRLLFSHAQTFEAPDLCIRILTDSTLRTSRAWLPVLCPSSKNKCLISSSLASIASLKVSILHLNLCYQLLKTLALA